MAHVENTVMDVYYRNDSMKSEGEEFVSWTVKLDIMGWIWYSQSRVKRGSRFAKSKIFIAAQSAPSFLRSLLGGEKTAETPHRSFLTYGRAATFYVSSNNIENPIR